MELLFLLKMTVFWDVALCGLVETDQRFRGAYCLHRQGNECPSQVFLICSVMMFQANHLQLDTTLKGHTLSSLKQVGRWMNDDWERIWKETVFFFSKSCPWYML
jgi:hypothetical protein